MEFPSIYPSVNQLVIKKNIITDTSVPSVNPLVIIFFYYQRIYRRIKNYRWKIHRQSIFIDNFVGKLITDGNVSYVDINIPSVNLLNGVMFLANQ